MNVRLTQLDGALPNIALMKLAHWHRAKGDTVHVTRRIEPDLWEPQYGTVYGSAIFSFTQLRLMRFQQQWPGAIVGGTGTPFVHTIEDLIGVGRDEYEHYDYSGFQAHDTQAPELPRDFKESIGYTQRGCRMAGPKSICRNFCVVPVKEGFARPLNTIAAIWRGTTHPKKLHILDNDFFGNAEWPQRIDEIRAGKFKVCLSQGINTRLVNADNAAALATIEYRNTKFNERRLYTAWDNFGDERVFFKGVDTLERAGVPSKHLMTYMLIGCDPAETWLRIWHRFYRMVERGIQPYPMVFDRKRADLLCFQRWVITGLYRIVPWDQYERETKSPESVAAWKLTVKPIPVLTQPAIPANGDES